MQDGVELAGDAVNVTGTSHVLESLADRPETRVVLVGSAQQYGLAAAGRPLVETDPSTLVAV